MVVPKKFQLQLHHMIILQSQVLSLLSIQHHKSRVYHSQSQGALKRFYQTLKLTLRNYCLDSGGTKAVFVLECLSYFVKKSSSSMIYTRPNALKLLSTEDDIISELFNCL